MKAKTTTLFQNPVLERLTRTNAYAAISLYYCFATAALVYTVGWLPIAWYQALAVFFAGILCWTLFEYVLHRFIFHFHSHEAAGKKFQYTVHGVHHEYPNDNERQVMPLIVALPLAVVIFTLFLVVMQMFGFALFAGFISGYASYLLIHYSIHIRRPPKNVFRFWWKYHSIHHYKGEDLAYGVSTPLWDVIFGTYPHQYLGAAPSQNS
jgi:4-hydroxysphinganine ceramide fatty acyl 2-hydroxylase